MPWPTVPTDDALPPVPRITPFVSGTRRLQKKWRSCAGTSSGSSGCLTARTGSGSARWIRSPVVSGTRPRAGRSPSSAGLCGSVPHASAPDSRRLVAGSGRQVCLWDATTGRRIAVLASHEHQVANLAVSPDGQRIASHGDDEDHIDLRDAVTGQEVAVLRGGLEYQGALTFSPDGSRLVSGSLYPDNTVRLWDASTGRRIAEMQGHKNTIRWVAFGPDGRRIVSASYDQTARLWDGWIRPAHRSSPRPHARVWNASSAPVASGSSQPRPTRRYGSGTRLRRLDRRAARPPAEVAGAAFAATGALLVSRSWDGESRIWDMELAERNGILRGHEGFVYDVAFSPDGARTASAAWDGTVRLWDATTGRQTAVLRHGSMNSAAGIVSSVAWHPDGSQLATVTRDDTIHLWDLTTGQRIRVFHAATGDWQGDARAVFNPAGTLLAAGSRDGSVRLWDGHRPVRRHARGA